MMAKPFQACTCQKAILQQPEKGKPFSKMDEHPAHQSVSYNKAPTNKS
jgi:hypothetical protein